MATIGSQLIQGSAPKVSALSALAPLFLRLGAGLIAGNQRNSFIVGRGGSVNPIPQSQGPALLAQALLQQAQFQEKAQGRQATQDLQRARIEALRAGTASDAAGAAREATQLDFLKKGAAGLRDRGDNILADLLLGGAKGIGAGLTRETPEEDALRAALKGQRKAEALEPTDQTARERDANTAVDTAKRKLALEPASNLGKTVKDLMEGTGRSQKDAELLALDLLRQSGKTIVEDEDGRAIGFLNERGQVSYFDRAVSREEGKKAAKARDTSFLSSAGAANVAVLKREISKIGTGAVGLRRLAAEKIGGYLGQVNKALESGFVGAITGSTPEKIQSIHTQGVALINSMIGEITGEESGRFTEQERALANEVGKVIKAGASLAQVNSSLGELLSMKLFAEEREAIRGGLPQSYDLTTIPGAKVAVKDLRKLGLSDDAIRQLLDKIKIFYERLARRQ